MNRVDITILNPEREDALNNRRPSAHVPNSFQNSFSKLADVNSQNCSDQSQMTALNKLVNCGSFTLFEASEAKGNHICGFRLFNTVTNEGNPQTFAKISTRSGRI